jgi:hypothetical protein
MTSVAIIVHRRHGFEASGYFLRHIADLWRERGVRVSVERDPDSRAQADVGILHVDLTVVPPEYLALAARYSRTINARVADISKRTISRQLVSRGDAYDGPVIIKTNLNCGGMREARLSRRGGVLGRLLARFGLRKPVPTISTHEYPVLPSPREVPPAVWDDPSLVVERYLVEREGDLYCMRSWVFLGDRFTHTKWWSRLPVIKADTAIRRAPLDEPPPPDLVARRRELGFDFAKFDYGQVDGRAVLYDANRTPSVGNVMHDQLRTRLLVLEKGLEAVAKPDERPVMSDE